MKKKSSTRNDFEKKLFKQIKKSKVSFEYETEKIPYVLERNYIPDFIIKTPSGKIYIEAKGHFDRDARAKMAAVKRQHPGLDIRFVFYRRDKKNIKWAERHNFPYTIGDIPKEWLNEAIP